MAANRIENPQTLSQVPPCPICHQTDQVQKMQTAVERGWVQMQAPTTSRGTKVMWLWVALAVLVYGGANMYLFAQLGGGPGFASWPLPVQILEVVLVEVILVIGLVFSVLAFARFINARQETTWRYSQDEDGPRWQGLYHCQRDHVTFDAQNQRVLSAREMGHLLRVLPPEPGRPTVEERGGG